MGKPNVRYDDEEADLDSRLRGNDDELGRRPAKPCLTWARPMLQLRSQPRLKESPMYPIDTKAPARTIISLAWKTRLGAVLLALLALWALVYWAR